MGIFKGFKLFKKSAKKEAKMDATEPVLEPVVAEAEVKAAAEPVNDVVVAAPAASSGKEVAEPSAEPAVVEAAAAEDSVAELPEGKAEVDLVKDDASTVAESSKDGDAPTLKAEQGTEEPAAENAEVVEFVMPAAVAVEEELPAKTGWFSCTMCK
jgi:hypothetical protein